MKERLPYEGFFAIIPAYTAALAPVKWQLAVVRPDHFGFCPCSARGAPEECLDDARRLTRRYTEGEYLRGLGNMNYGKGASATAALAEHARRMLAEGKDVLGEELRSAVAGAKTPSPKKATLAGKYRPRAAAVPVPAEQGGWLFG